MTRIWAAGLWAVLVLAACSGDSDRPSTAGSGDAHCVDRDGDGYGNGCSKGDDCNDRDPEEATECLRCQQPNSGCPCELGSQPLTCYLDKTEGDDGQVMCNEGTRYCRDAQWSACENVHTYPLPPERAEANALIATDGGPVQCNDCSVNCFRISDNLDPIDGGLNDGNSSQTTFVPGGGLTLGTIPQDAAVEEPPYNPSTCMPGTAPDIDCDGIPDQFDPFPEEPPFATANPDSSTSARRDRHWRDRSRLLHQLRGRVLPGRPIGSMADERDRLKADLVSGDFINDPNFDCSDIKLNHLADDNGVRAKHRRRDQLHHSRRELRHGLSPRDPVHGLRGQ